MQKKAHIKKPAVKLVLGGGTVKIYSFSSLA